jgi:hypothetical protein
LSESIYSLFIHIKTPNHGLESSFDKGLILHFPDFSISALIGHEDIYLDMQPLPQHTSVLSSTLDHPPMTSFCRKLSDFTEEVDKETKHLDNLLKDLRDYYAFIKTKRQLGLDVPAGFRRESTHKQQFIMYSPPRKSSKISSNITENNSTLLPLSDLLASDSSYTLRDDTVPHLMISQHLSLSKPQLQTQINFLNHMLFLF